MRPHIMDYLIHCRMPCGFLLGSNVTPDQLASSWTPFYHLCTTRWSELPESWHITFLQRFFNVIHEGEPIKPDCCGTKWMEAVWEKVLRPRIQMVVIKSVQFPWLGVEGAEIMNEKWRRAGKEERKEKKGAKEQDLDQSVTGILETLAKLLEAATLHGLVTVDLAGAVSGSSLLADD